VAEEAANFVRKQFEACETKQFFVLRCEISCIFQLNLLPFDTKNAILQNLPGNHKSKKKGQKLDAAGSGCRTQRRNLQRRRRDWIVDT